MSAAISHPNDLDATSHAGGIEGGGDSREGGVGSLEARRITRTASQV